MILMFITLLFLIVLDESCSIVNVNISYLCDQLSDTECTITSDKVLNCTDESPLPAPTNWSYLDPYPGFVCEIVVNRSIAVFGGSLSCVDPLLCQIWLDVDGIVTIGSGDSITANTISIFASNGVYVQQSGILDTSALGLLYGVAPPGNGPGTGGQRKCLSSEKQLTNRSYYSDGVNLDSVANSVCCSGDVPYAFMNQTIGSFAYPELRWYEAFGSGGGALNSTVYGGRSGGRINITAPLVVLEGTISSNGETAPVSAASATSVVPLSSGSGGTVVISTLLLEAGPEGAGFISANGGGAVVSQSGGGGGGGVVLRYTDISVPYVNIDAAGGSFAISPTVADCFTAAAGTLFHSVFQNSSSSALASAERVLADIFASKARSILSRSLRTTRPQKYSISRAWVASPPPVRFNELRIVNGNHPALASTALSLFFSDTTLMPPSMSIAFTEAVAAAAAASRFSTFSPFLPSESAQEAGAVDAVVTMGQAVLATNRLVLRRAWEAVESVESDFTVGLSVSAASVLPLPGAALFSNWSSIYAPDEEPDPEASTFELLKISATQVEIGSGGVIDLGTFPVVFECYNFSVDTAANIYFLSFLSLLVNDTVVFDGGLYFDQGPLWAHSKANSSYSLHPRSLYDISELEAYARQWPQVNSADSTYLATLINSELQSSPASRASFLSKSLKRQLTYLTNKYDLKLMPPVLVSPDDDFQLGLASIWAQNALFVNEDADVDVGRAVLFSPNLIYVAGRISTPYMENVVCVDAMSYKESCEEIVWTYNSTVPSSYYPLAVNYTMVLFSPLVSISSTARLSVELAALCSEQFSLEGSISGVGRGCPPLAGPGAGSSSASGGTSGSGAGHAGSGGSSPGGTPGGAPYDVPFTANASWAVPGLEPLAPGSGGGGANAGAGGGFVRVRASQSLSVPLGGAILVDGAAATIGGGGSGGSLILETLRLTGGGLLSLQGGAAGGQSSSNGGGGGAGGFFYLKSALLDPLSYRTPSISRDSHTDSRQSLTHLSLALNRWIWQNRQLISSQELAIEPNPSLISSVLDDLLLAALSMQSSLNERLDMLSQEERMDVLGPEFRECFDTMKRQYARSRAGNYFIQFLRDVYSMIRRQPASTCQSLLQKPLKHDPALQFYGTVRAAGGPGAGGGAFGTNGTLLLPACAPGTYPPASDVHCVPCGVGYWSAPQEEEEEFFWKKQSVSWGDGQGSLRCQRCENAPPYGVYTSDSAASANCPYACPAGRLYPTCRSPFEQLVSLLGGTAVFVSVIVLLLCLTVTGSLLLWRHRRNAHLSLLDSELLLSFDDTLRNYRKLNLGPSLLLPTYFASSRQRESESLLQKVGWGSSRKGPHDRSNDSEFGSYGATMRADTQVKDRASRSGPSLSHQHSLAVTLLSGGEPFQISFVSPLLSGESEEEDLTRMRRRALQLSDAKIIGFLLFSLSLSSADLSKTSQTTGSTAGTASGAVSGTATTQRLHEIVNRIYLSGNNTFDAPFLLSAAVPPELAPHVLPEEFARFASVLNALLHWERWGWERMLYLLLQLLCFPLARMFLRARQRLRVVLLMQATFACADGFFWLRDPVVRALATGVRLGVSSDFSLAYLDLLPHVLSAGSKSSSAEQRDSTLTGQSPVSASINHRSLLLLLAGEGVYQRPLYLDPNDALVRAVPTLRPLDRIIDNEWLETVAELNARLKCLTKGAFVQSSSHVLELLRVINSDATLLGGLRLDLVRAWIPSAAAEARGTRVESKGKARKRLPKFFNSSPPLALSESAHSSRPSSPRSGSSSDEEEIPARPGTFTSLSGLLQGGWGKNDVGLRGASAVRSVGRSRRAASAGASIAAAAAAAAAGFSETEDNHSGSGSVSGSAHSLRDSFHSGGSVPSSFSSLHRSASEESESESIPRSGGSRSRKTLKNAAALLVDTDGIPLTNSVDISYLLDAHRRKNRPVSTRRSPEQQNPQMDVFSSSYTSFAKRSRSQGNAPGLRAPREDSFSNYSSLAYESVVEPLFLDSAAFPWKHPSYVKDQSIPARRSSAQVLSSEARLAILLTYPASDRGQSTVINARGGASAASLGLGGPRLEQSFTNPTFDFAGLDSDSGDASRRDAMRRADPRQLAIVPTALGHGDTVGFIRSRGSTEEEFMKMERSAASGPEDTPESTQTLPPSGPVVRRPQQQRLRSLLSGEPYVGGDEDAIGARTLLLPGLQCPVLPFLRPPVPLDQLDPVVLRSGRSFLFPAVANKEGTRSVTVRKAREANSKWIPVRTVATPPKHYLRVYSRVHRCHFYVRARWHWSLDFDGNRLPTDVQEAIASRARARAVEKVSLHSGGSWEGVLSSSPGFHSETLFMQKILLQALVLQVREAQHAVDSLVVDAVQVVGNNRDPSIGQARTHPHYRQYGLATPGSRAHSNSDSDSDSYNSAENENHSTWANALMGRFGRRSFAEEPRSGSFLYNGAPDGGETVDIMDAEQSDFEETPIRANIHNYSSTETADSSTLPSVSAAAVASPLPLHRPPRRAYHPSGPSSSFSLGLLDSFSRLFAGFESQIARGNYGQRLIDDEPKGSEMSDDSLGDFDVLERESVPLGRRRSRSESSLKNDSKNLTSWQSVNKLGSGRSPSRASFDAADDGWNDGNAPQYVSVPAIDLPTVESRASCDPLAAVLRITFLGRRLLMYSPPPIPSRFRFVNVLLPFVHLFLILVELSLTIALTTLLWCIEPLDDVLTSSAPPPHPLSPNGLARAAVTYASVLSFVLSHFLPSFKDLSGGDLLLNSTNTTQVFIEHQSHFSTYTPLSYLWNNDLQNPAHVASVGGTGDAYSCSFTGLLIYLFVPPLTCLLPSLYGIAVVSLGSSHSLRSFSAWNGVSLWSAFVGLVVVSLFSRELGLEVLPIPLVLLLTKLLLSWSAGMQIAGLEALRPIRGWRGLYHVRHGPVEKARKEQLLRR